MSFNIMVIVMININIITITVIVIMIVHTLLCDCYDNINFHTMQGFFFFSKFSPIVLPEKQKHLSKKKHWLLCIFMIILILF